MTNRAILGLFDGTYRLRVSTPGFNVLSTGLSNNQLAFDSDWPNAVNIHMAGLTTANNQTISFGTTFDAPPLAMAWVGGSGVWSFVNQDYMGNVNTPIAADDYNITRAQAKFRIAGTRYIIFR